MNYWKKIQIKGQIITIDAMGTQTSIAEKIKKPAKRHMVR